MTIAFLRNILVFPPRNFGHWIIVIIMRTCSMECDFSDENHQFSQYRIMHMCHMCKSLVFVCLKCVKNGNRV